MTGYLGNDERAPGAGAELIAAAMLLALLLIALWSLLSQLLLWSDSAVMKVRTRPRDTARAPFDPNPHAHTDRRRSIWQVPAGVHVTDATRSKEGDDDNF